jgi:hypothetical protein
MRLGLPIPINIPPEWKPNEKKPPREYPLASVFSLDEFRLLFSGTVISIEPILTHGKSRIV